MRQRSKLHWSNVVCCPWAIVVHNVEPTLGQRRNAIWEEISVSANTMKYNKSADESGVIVVYMKALEVEEVVKLRLDEWNIEWRRYPERVEREWIELNAQGWKNG